jgi:hypothetical protein
MNHLKTGKGVKARFWTARKAVSNGIFHHGMSTVGNTGKFHFNPSLPIPGRNPILPGSENLSGDGIITVLSPLFLCLKGVNFMKSHYYEVVISAGGKATYLYGSWTEAWRKLCEICHNDPHCEQVLTGIWKLNKGFVYLRSS